MAKTTDTIPIWLGSKYNQIQGKVAIPAGPSAEQPGLLFLESRDGSGVLQTGLYVWADSAGALRYSATLPTDEDADGTSIGAGGATAALDNLASVAINDSLISDTDNTDDLGSSAKQWKDIYINGTAHLDLAEADAGNIGRTAGAGANYIKIASGGTLTMEGTATVDGVGSGNLVDKSAAETVTGGWDFTTAAVEIKEDSLKLGFGAAGVSDSYILFDGTKLIFYDTNVGSATSLADLLSGTTLNPNVVGDLTISDGKFNWTDATDEVAATWSFANTGAGSDIDIASSADTGEVIHIIANSLTTGQVLDIETDSIGAAGALVYLDVTEAGHNATGNFIQCFNGAADVFEVGKYGAMVIAGTASGTDILTATAGDITLTNGDITLTDGDLVMAEGMINVDTTTDETSYIIRNVTGATSAVLEVEATHTGDVGVGVLIDVNGTGNSTALQISHDGDYPVIDIDAGAARIGNVIDIAMANQLAQTALDITGAATGTSGEGIIHVDVTGVLAGNPIRVDSTGANAATGQLLYLLSTGAQAGATNGICGYFSDTGAAAATSYTVYINSTNNEALHVDAGEVLVDEFVTATEGVVTNYDGTQDLSATPLNSEFDTCFGATALGKAGWMGIAKDSGGTPVYFVTSDGTDWWYAALTKAL